MKTMAVTGGTDISELVRVTGPKQGARAYAPRLLSLESSSARSASIRLFWRESCVEKEFQDRLMCLSGYGLLAFAVFRIATRTRVPSETSERESPGQLLQDAVRTGLLHF